MATNTHKDPEDRFLISLSDIVSLFRQFRTPIFCWTVLLGLAGVLFALMAPIRYRAEGTFREKGIKGGDTGMGSSSVLQLLNLGNIASESEAISLIKSRKLMREMIEKLHLQGNLEAQSDRESLLKRIYHNLQIVWTALQKKPQPALKDPFCPLKIEALHYEGEIPFSLVLHLQEDGSYEVYHLHPSKHSIGWGRLGESFQFEQLSITLIPTQADHPLVAQSFSLTINSIANVAEDLANHIQIESCKNDYGLLKITWEYRHRHTASTLINTIMTCYQNYLRTYHDHLALKQLDYLNLRRDQLTQNLNRIMQEYADFISHDLWSTGMIDSTKEMEFLAKSQQEYKEKLLANELEVESLKRFTANNVAYHEGQSRHEKDPEVINLTLGRIRNLKHERDILAIELQKKVLTYGADFHPSSEYQGVNLEAAHAICVDYFRRLFEIESAIRQNLFFIHQIEDPNFEITSLSLELEDPVSLEIIEKASHLVLNLRDQNNQSLREQERIKGDLLLQRAFLTEHLKQKVSFMELNKKLIDEKVFALQHVSLGLLNQQISLLEKYLEDYMQLRIDNLKEESTLIKHHLEGIYAEMANLPKKWAAEKLIEQEATTNQLIVEEIAKMVELKNISNNLDVIQSAPVDPSLPPVHPLTPHVFLWGLIGCFLGGSLSSGIALGRTLSKGLKVSAHNLQLMGYHVSGILTPSLDGPATHQPQAAPLETLRRLQIYFDPPVSTEALPCQSREAKLLLLLEGEGPHYAPELADLFLKRGKRVLTLDLNFHEVKESLTPGLLQYLQHEIPWPTIQKGHHGDWIAAGGMSPFIVEQLSSPIFHELLEQLKLDYDWILAVSPARPRSVEAESLVPLFPYIAITLEQEKVEELNFYFHLREQSSHHQLTFILGEKS